MEAYLTAVHGPERAIPDPALGFYFYGSLHPIGQHASFKLPGLDETMLGSLVDAVRDKNKFVEAEQRLSSQRKKSKKKGPASLDLAAHPLNLSQSEDSEDESERVVFRQVTSAGVASKASEGARLPSQQPMTTTSGLESRPSSVVLKSKVLFEALSSLPSVTAAEPAAAPAKPQPRRRKKLVDTEVSPTLKMRGKR